MSDKTQLREFKKALEQIADLAEPSENGSDLWERGRLDGQNEAADIARKALGLPPLIRCLTCRAHTSRVISSCQECK